MAPEQASSESIKIAGDQLLSSLADLQDTLSFAVEKDPRLTNDPAAEALRESAERLANFTGLNTRLSAATLRFVRQRDEKKLLPGQHPGIHLSFAAPLDHKTLEVNFYGGLRVTSSGDYHDGDASLKHSHTTTTDKILEQPIEFNWQFSGPRQSVDSWIRLVQLGGFLRKPLFQLSSLKLDGNSFDIHPALKEGDTNFTSIRNSLASSIRDLTTMIPFK